MSRHIKKIKSIFKYDKVKVKSVISQIEKFSNSEYIVIYNPEYIGITNSTKEIFDNRIELKEIFKSKEISDIAESIATNNIKQVIFSSIAYGYKTLAEKVYEKNSDIQIKFFWHGSHSLFVNRDEEYFLNSILDLAKRNIVKSIGFAKESIAEYYKLKGYNSYFVKNTVNNIEVIKKDKIENSDNIKIGIYSSGDRWEKNTYNQLSACSLIPNALVECIPTTKVVKDFCDIMNIKLNCEYSFLNRQALLQKMSHNDINMYVTFTECAPMIPLESLEVGVPCLLGNNNHYFNKTELEQYLVVNSEDSIDEIAEKTMLCIKNKDKIIELYRKWKKTYDLESKQSVNDFLERR